MTEIVTTANTMVAFAFGWILGLIAGVLLITCGFDHHK